MEIENVGIVCFQPKCFEIHEWRNFQCSDIWKKSKNKQEKAIYAKKEKINNGPLYGTIQIIRDIEGAGGGRQSVIWTFFTF